MKSRLLVAAALLPSAVSADLLSRDSFSGYALGQLQATTSPTIAGYTGNWTGIDFGDAKPAVTAESLSYADINYAAGIGNKVSVPVNPGGDEIEANDSGRVFRLLDSSLTATGATAGTFYLSFLFQSGQETGATTYQTLALFNADTADANRNFDIGFNGGTIYNFGVNDTAGPNQTYHDTGVTADTGVHLFVVKFTLSDVALSDSVTVWVDPVLGAGEPAGGTTVSGRDLAWDRIALSDYDGNSCAWDEIRWGTDFDSVTIQSFLPSVPAFESQPSDFFGDVGDTVMLPSSAPADPAPTYHWEFSATGSDPWSAVPLANSATLEIPDAPFSSNGFYRAVATNANGSATSDGVLVDLIYPAPVITSQPVSVFAEIGTNVTLTVEATGIGELTYQWIKDFGLLDGETAATLELPDLQEEDAGEYWVEITDPAAEADGEFPTFTASNSAFVEVIDPWDGLVSHDPFEPAAGYVAGALAAQDPAITGYVNPWEITNGFGPISPVVTPGSLVYLDSSYLGSSGDRVTTPADAEAINATNSGRVGRLLDPQLIVNDNTTGTRYLSWLFRSGLENAAPDPQVYQTLALFNGALGTDGNRDFEAGIAVGDFATTNFAYRLNNNSGMIGNLGVSSDANVHLFVAKIELGDTPGSDTVTVWIDPALGGGDPAGGVTLTGADLLWDRIAFSDYASDSSAWDEVRWGSTFDSVTLNPNPPDDFATWIGGFDVGALDGFDDDADGDGIKNGIENVFGTDPSVKSQGITQVEKSGGSVTFQHPQSGAAASDVTAAYRWTTDLENFHASGESVGGTTVTLTPAANTPSPGTTRVTAVVAGIQPGRLFLVLEANQTP